MTLLKRRTLLAAASTLPAVLHARKPHAATTPVLPSLDPTQPGKDTPDIQFTTADGATRTLADYKGQAILLNFWATWCVPCVAEMPALARLAAATAGSNIAILPLSSDRGGAPAVDRYFKEKSITGLPTLLDPKGAAARAFGARGIPTTILIDPQGRERARLEGAAEWDDPAAIKALKALAS